MAAFDYARPLVTANRLIDRFGQTGALRRTGAATGPAHNPTKGSPTDHSARFVVTDFSNNEVDGTRVLATDKKVLMSVGSLTIEPATSDLLVEASGAVYKIAAIEPLRPAETTLMYTLQCRR